MKIVYDDEVDVLTITLNADPVADSDEVHPGVIFDYDKSGKAIGIEVLDASRRFENLQLENFQILIPDYAEKNTTERNKREVTAAAVSAI